MLQSRESGFLDAADVGGVELREGNLSAVASAKAEALGAEIFQRRAYQVELRVVDDEEAVVEVFVVADGEFRVLGVEGLDVGGERSWIAASAWRRLYNPVLKHNIRDTREVLCVVRDKGEVGLLCDCANKKIKVIDRTPLFLKLML